MGQVKVSPHHPETSRDSVLPLFFVNNVATVFQQLFLKRSFFFGGDLCHVITSLIQSQRLRIYGGSCYQLVYNLVPREAVINECVSTQWGISFHSRPPVITCTIGTSNGNSHNKLLAAYFFNCISK